MWFTTLPPNLFLTYGHLEFIKQKLFRGKTKLNVKDLAQILRKDSESIDAYMSMFKKMKARYVTMNPKYDLV